MSLITVVIPFYSNIEGLLEKAVISVLNQSIKDIEVIVVDDCSPLKACNELINITDERLKIVRHDVNKHGGIARNTGVELAQGQFIAFLDYDDIWYEDKLKKQYDLYQAKLVEMGNNIVIYSRCKIIDGKRSFIRPTRKIEYTESVGDYLFAAREIIQTSGVFLPTHLALRAPFHDLKRHQDYQLCLSLEQAGAKFVLHEDVNYEFIQIPKKIDYYFAQWWLSQYQSYLTNTAVKGFQSLVIIRAMIAAKKYKVGFKFALKNRLLLVFIESFIKRKARELLRLAKVVK